MPGRKRILALDIGASKLVLAEFILGRSRELQLTNYGLARLEVEQEDDASRGAAVVAGIRAVMAERGIRPAPLLMSVTGQAVFPRFVKLPPVARDKIAQIVRYEAEQNVPFPIDEVVWDYTVVGNENGEPNVMLVAAKIESVQRLTQCALAVGMEPEIVDAAPMALCNAVRYNYPDLRACTMVLDIGARTSNLILVEGNRVFSRSIPVAGNAITAEIAKEFETSPEEAEALKREHAFVAFGGVYGGPDSKVADRVSKIARNVIARLHAEVNRSVNFYRSQQGGTAPALVLLTGGSSIIPHTDTFFREKLNAEVEYFNPFINIPVSQALDTEQIRGDLQHLGVVAGLALRRALRCPIEVNLMPPDLAAKKVFRRRQPYFALAAAGVALTMLCWWAYLYQMRGVLEAQSFSIRDRVSRLAEVQGRLDDVLREKTDWQGRIDRLVVLIGRRTQWNEMIAAVQACMLDGMWLRSIEPITAADGSITHLAISGTGFIDKLVNQPNLSAVEGFRNRLRQQKCFLDTDETAIKMEPPVGSDAFAREFVLWVGLREPIRPGGE
ncbi:MAG: type IV pilus assembly protein PilM [Lentisphaerae bacterium]|nr:type IV pilus assembly protein PilM [Lentisphaerota bacterium]